MEGEHGSHALMYDVEMEKMREALHEEVDDLGAIVENKKESLLEKLNQILDVLEKKIAHAIIPAHMSDVVDYLDTVQEITEFKKYVNEQVTAFLDECTTMEEVFDLALDAANEKFLIVQDKNANTLTYENEIVNCVSEY